MLKKFGKFHTKTSEPLFNKVAGLKACNVIKKHSNAVFSCEIIENFTNTYFEEHLRTMPPERLRKISPLLLLGKPLLDGKRRK